MRPGDLPFTAHFQQMPCGVRAKYVGAGCRCLRCRAAASRYETERAAARRRGEWNGLVSAERARTHLRWLSRKGIGRRAVSAASDVGKTTVQEVKSGKKTQIRAETERRILAVDHTCIADGALVNARPTWRRLARLLGEGYPARRLCRFMGYKGDGLQFGARHVTARTAAKVERLYVRLTAEARA